MADDIKESKVKSWVQNYLNSRKDKRTQQATSRQGPVQTKININMPKVKQAAASTGAAVNKGTRAAVNAARQTVGAMTGATAGTARILNKATNAAALANTAYRGVYFTFKKILNIIIIIGFFLALGYGALYASTTIPGESFPDKLDYIKERYMLTLQRLDPFGTIKQEYSELYAISTGQSYAGDVDSNARKDLGVYLDIRPPSEKLYSDSSIAVFADLKAQTTEDIGSIDVKITCKSDNVLGNVYPAGFSVKDKHEEAIDCTFNTGSNVHETGSHIVAFNADFNFKTKSYLLNYFIDEDYYQQFEAENILDYHEVEDKSPLSQSENGPMQLNIETVSIQPIRVKDEPLPPIGISLKNRWSGRIAKINSLTFFTPKGVSVVTDRCVDASVEQTISSKEGYNAYKVTDLSKFTNITSLKSFRCRLDVSNQDILFGNKFTADYFFAEAEYDYTLEKSTLINVI